MYKSSKSPYQTFIYFPLQGQPGRPGPSGESGSDGLPVSISHQYSGPKLFEGHVLDLVQVDSHSLAARLRKCDHSFYSRGYSALLYYCKLDSKKDTEY